MIHAVLFLIITVRVIAAMALMLVTLTFASATPNMFFFVSDTLDLRLPKSFRGHRFAFQACHAIAPVLFVRSINGHYDE